MTHSFFLPPLGATVAAQNYQPPPINPPDTRQIQGAFSLKRPLQSQKKSTKEQSNSFMPYSEFEALSKVVQQTARIQQDGGVYVDSGGILRIKALSDTAQPYSQTASSAQGLTSQVITDKGTYTSRVLRTDNGNLDFYLTNNHIQGTLAAISIPYAMQQLMQTQSKMPMLADLGDNELQQISSLLTVWYVSMMKTVNTLTKPKKSNTSDGSGNSQIFGSIKSGKGNTLQNHHPAEYCFNHDMECTGVPNYLKVGWAGGEGGFYTVDFKECCLEHDINLFCGPPLVISEWNQPAWWDQARIYSAYISSKLAECILEKFVNKSTEIPWYYNWGLGTLYFATLGAIVGTAYAIGTNVFDLYTMWNQYYPQDGRNKQSCLCGGDTPTVWCNDPCRDLCRERGKPSRCFMCHWRCEYDPNKPGSKAIAVHFIDGRATNTPCCANTKRGCRSDNKEQEVLNNCPQCAHCYTKCVADPKIPGKFYRVVVNPTKIPGTGIETYLPCCPGSNLDFKEPCKQYDPYYPEYDIPDYDNIIRPYP